jgi:hypothetical protein
MRTIRAHLANRPTLSGFLVIAIALVVAACSPGGAAGPGY